MTATERDLYRAWEVIETSDDTTADLAKHIAEALADERERALAPVLALAEEYERHAGLMRAQQDSVGVVDVVERWRAFADAAESIRRAAQDPPC